MKEFTYCITFPDGTQKFENVQARDVVEGHWKLYRKYEGQKTRTYWVRPNT